MALWYGSKILGYCFPSGVITVFEILVKMSHLPKLYQKIVNFGRALDKACARKSVRSIKRALEKACARKSVRSLI